MEACRVCISIVATALLLFPLCIDAGTSRALAAKVERVSDGDTPVAITENKTKLRIRLLGIDAPEIPHGKKPGQPFGEEVRDYLDHLIRCKTIQWTLTGRSVSIASWP